MAQPWDSTRLSQVFFTLRDTMDLESEKIHSGSRLRLHWSFQGTRYSRIFTRHCP